MITEVEHNLYISDWQDAKALRDWVLSASSGSWSLLASDIHIITVAIDSPFIGDYHYKLVDGDGFDINEFINAVAKLKELREQNNRVLVHCVSGISRSASVIIAYLLQKSNYTLNYNDVYTWMLTKRFINPHKAFVDYITKNYHVIS